MTEPDLTTTDKKLRRVLLFILTASFVLTPVATPDVWWQLSRGHVVVSYLAPPGPILTAGTPLNEADWLGGLPFYLSFQLAGFSGLMLLKCTAVGLLLFLFLKRFEDSLNWLAFFIVVLILVTGNSAWQPTPRLLDCWFLFLTWFITARWCREPSAKTMVPILLVLALWANSSPLCLLGIAVVALAPLLPGFQSENKRPLKQTTLLILFSLLALMLTPRGWFTPYDSFLQLFPGLFYHRDLLALTVWHPTFLNGTSIEVIGLSILSVVTALFLICKSTSWIETIAFLAFAIPAWTNYDSLAPCAIGIALVLSQTMVAHQFQLPFAKWKQAISPAFGRYLLILGILILSWKSAAGSLPGQSQRLGWGIAPELDITLLNQTIGPINYEGTAHSMGIAPTGMLCWIKADHKIQPVRTLRQALLQGLLFEELSLNEELSNDWIFQHPRADGSWGGWWIRLKNRNCQLLLVPNGDEKTIRALFDSRWQPMSVDASVIPYGWSGDILSTPKIVELLRAKDFLNRDQWTYSLPSPSGTPECSDWWGILSGTSNLKPAILQAKTFRGMKLYIAALRVLHPLLQHDPSPQVIHEFQLCQKELAYQEKLEMGQRRPSFIRSFSLIQLAGKTEGDFAHTGPVLNGLEEPIRTSDSLERAILKYIQGDWETALKILSDNNSETLYAKAQILLESGDPSGAAETFRELIQLYPKDQLVVPSQRMLDSIP
ncbi:tetratricopeptide repeat protein [uncultured Gimesia sp.]|uniref:tetratricopeptide repeat protein n=1 Tax=uncultured Gimesia sp. TaxID=1678688 RepID=UPI0030DC6B38|tara:strand:- start:67354 stop:69501 length:2148 start_codon:yes stop_codon:yes gene_type:complete